MNGEQVGSEDQFPFRGSPAQTLLQRGLEESMRRARRSQREIARELGYKTSTVISHMATGRAPIPPERAIEIANACGLDPDEFTAAVLLQRYPSLTDFLSKRRAPERVERSSSLVATELEMIAGAPLDQLAPEQRRVLREVVADRRADARWLSVHELPVVGLIRSLRPGIRQDGLAPEDISSIEAALGKSG